MFQVVVVGAPEVVGDFAKSAVVFATKETAIVTQFGQIYQTRVRARASGRPGPRAITGAYRRSIALEIRRSTLGTEAEVGTNAPQGRRLELGFVGVDSLGRHFSQPPYPHFSPDLERTVLEMEAALDAAVGRI